MMHRNRHNWAAATFTLMIMFTGGIADAQVAVTPLNPSLLQVAGVAGPVNAGFVPVNPAAMQWGTPWRVGGGRIEAKESPEGAPSGTFNGAYVGARAVGEQFSAGGEYVRIDSNNDNNTSFDLLETETFGLSGRVTSYLSVGVEYVVQDIREGTVETAVESRMAGFSIRLGESFFLGGVLGEDELELVDRGVAKGPGNPISATRDFRIYGAGLRLGGGMRFHAEYYLVERDSFSSQGSTFGDVKGQVGVIEIGLAGFVLGYRTSQVDLEDRGGRTKTETSATDLVWAPDEGLSIGIHVEDSTQDVGVTGATNDTSVTSISLTYLF